MIMFSASYTSKPLVILSTLSLISLSIFSYPSYISAEEAKFLNHSISESNFPSKLKPLVKKLSAQLEDENADLEKTEANIISEISQHPRGYHDELYYLLGLVREKAKDYDSAVEAYDNALERRARDPKLLIRKAISLKNSKDCKGAIETLNEARWWLTEASFEVELLLAECFFRLEQPKKAENLLNSAHLKNPNYLPIKNLLLETKIKKLERTPDPTRKSFLEAEIAILLEQINIIDPGNTKVTKLYSRSALRKIDPVMDSVKLSNIETKLSKIAQSTAYKDAEVVSLYLEALRKSGKHDLAKEVLDKGLTNTPESSLLLDASAQLAIELGEEP